MHTYILIPVFNTAAVTFDCLQSLRNLEGPPFSVIIGDNGSREDQRLVLEEHLRLQKYPYPVSLIRNPVNKGFGAINNLMVRNVPAGDCHVFFLNNDTAVEKNCLIELMSAFTAAGQCGGVCPLICYYDDPRRIWYGGGRISLRKKNVFTHCYMDKPREAFGPSVRQTDFLTGCALFTTRKIFEDAGGFDERLFLYCEDVDLSLRMRSAGKVLLVAGSAAVLHKVSASVHKEDNARVNFMLTSSTLYCCLKHFPFLGKCVVALKILRKIAGFSLKILDKKNYPLMRSYLKGVAHGFRLYGQGPLN